MPKIDGEKLRALIEMAAGLTERLHRSQEAAAYRRVLEMIDGLDAEAEAEAVCRICGRGKIVDGFCDICGIEYRETNDEGREPFGE